jgi:NAD+ synthase
MYNMKNIKKQVVDWLNSYATESGCSGFVVGISGGIDSAVTSTLCAMTGFPVTAVSMPIHQDPKLHSLSEVQQKWLEDNFSNVLRSNIDLSQVYDSFESAVLSTELGMANTKARLRMATLYAISARYNYLVAGTGNKVEDFGVGFFTKYGDGGVDLSPIADLMKSEVYELAKELGIPQEIQDAPPTDGLWEDGRVDEDQLFASYDELEWAMTYNNDRRLLSREKEVLDIYNKHRTANLHKMLPIPVCKIER